MPLLCCAVLVGAVCVVLQLLKLMEQFPDVVFLKVDFDSNKAMCKTLGVKVCTVCDRPGHTCTHKLLPFRA